MNKKKCAILLRGHTKRRRMDQHDPIDFNTVLGGIQSFKENVLTPLREEYDVDVYMVPSDNENIQSLCTELSPRQFWLSMNEGDLAQSTNMLDGLSSLRRLDHYNKILITRFDIIYKKRLTDFLKDRNEDVVIPFKDVQTTPDRLCDTMHWINNDEADTVFDRFIESLLDVRNNTQDFNSKYTWEKRERTFHDLYAPMIQRKLSVGFMVDGNYDSNSSRWPGAWNLPEGSKNPIYALSGRLYFFDDIKHPTLFQPRRA